MFILVLVVIIAVAVIIFALVKLGQGVKYQDEMFKATMGTSPYDSAPKKDSKDASVVGRAVAGGIIAGPAGAVVGAVSAVNKNNKNKK